MCRALFVVWIATFAFHVDPVSRVADGEETPIGEVWITTASPDCRLQRQILTSGDRGSMKLPEVMVEDAVVRQSIEGFGYTLTGGSVELLQRMAVKDRAQLLEELFGVGTDSLQVRFLRLTMGASDLDDRVFSYNDLDVDREDQQLSQFDMSTDQRRLIPLLREIQTLAPNMTYLATPWSAPAWMKSNGQTVGGHLESKYYATYAQYFVRYLQTMRAAGISIPYVTVQNEPENGLNQPSMLMSAEEQAEFVGGYLGPALRDARLPTKIVIWDHNCDRPEFPLHILRDARAASFVHGTAFHLYAGEIAALSRVHEAAPAKAIYFTEQWTATGGDFGGDLLWHMQQVIIGSLRNWSQSALEWNLASDPSAGPHTPGGCTNCQGALTLAGNHVTRNVSYFIIAHASRFVPPGSVCISSSGPDDLPHVALRTPTGAHVLLVAQPADHPVIFRIRAASPIGLVTLPPRSVATIRWNAGT